MVLSRSYLYSALRLRFGGEDQLKTTNTIGLGLRRAPNALTSDQVLADPELVQRLVAAYLSNWRKLIELSKAYDFPAGVCVPSAHGRFGTATTPPKPCRRSGSTPSTALYDETDKQLGGLRQEYPGVALLNLLSPA